MFRHPELAPADWTITTAAYLGAADPRMAEEHIAGSVTSTFGHIEIVMTPYYGIHGSGNRHTTPSN